MGGTGVGQMRAFVLVDACSGTGVPGVSPKIERVCAGEPRFGDSGDRRDSQRAHGSLRSGTEYRPAGSHANWLAPSIRWQVFLTVSAFRPVASAIAFGGVGPL